MIHPDMHAYQLSRLPDRLMTSSHAYHALQAMDPRNPTLSLVFEGDLVFPVGEHATPEWLGFLLDVGLQNRIDRDAFLRSTSTHPPTHTRLTSS